MILEGDCVEKMRELDESSVDAIVTDPPYGLEFMGKEWDRLEGARIRQPSKRDQTPGAAHNSTTSLVSRNQPDAYVAGPRMQEWHRTWATEALRVLKPGGHLLAFGGTRTYHRLACAIEDAGFEIRDCLVWMYGSGFPKSLDVSKVIDKAAGAEREVVGQYRAPDGKARWGGNSFSVAEPPDGRGESDLTAPATPEAAQWEGWGTALKPAHEPIVLARKPLTGTVAANVLEHGTGALNIDGCRIGTDTERGERYNDKAPGGTTAAFQPRDRKTQVWDVASGRWPANVALDPEAAAMLDEQSGECKPPGGPGRQVEYTSDPLVTDFAGKTHAQGPLYLNESGGASRFFLTAQRHSMQECAGVNTAAPSSSQSSQPDASAQSDVPTGEHHGDSTSTGPPSSSEPSTTEMQSGSKLRSESDTPTTPSTERKSSPESKRQKPSRKNNPANPAEPSEPTDTTTTTPSRSKSDGSAEAATSKDTPVSVAPGVLDSDETRFRYCAKSSRGERNAGLDGFEEREQPWLHDDGRANPKPLSDPRMDRPQERRPTKNGHPTVKPIDLMRWLVRLVTPPGGTVLDPFAGSGTTGCAAVLEGFNFLGIERETEYAAIARARIEWWSQFPGELTEEILVRAGFSERLEREHSEAGQLGLEI